jgi:hypothetical protein
MIDQQIFVDIDFSTLLFNNHSIIFTNRLRIYRKNCIYLLNIFQNIKSGLGLEYLYALWSNLHETRKHWKVNSGLLITFMLYIVQKCLTEDTLSAVRTQCRLEWFHIEFSNPKWLARHSSITDTLSRRWMSVMGSKVAAGCNSISVRGWKKNLTGCDVNS